MSTHPSRGYLITSAAVGSLKPTEGGMLKSDRISVGFTSVSVFFPDNGIPTRTSNPSEVEATATSTNPNTPVCA
ncbi:unnamed protein product [Prunus armeniaca]